jgi:hypothetical protein
MQWQTGFPQVNEEFGEFETPAIIVLHAQLKRLGLDKRL